MCWEGKCLYMGEKKEKEKNGRKMWRDCECQIKMLEKHLIKWTEESIREDILML